jgi:hypothetical protein
MHCSVWSIYFVCLSGFNLSGNWLHNGGPYGVHVQQNGCNLIAQSFLRSTHILRGEISKRTVRLDDSMGYLVNNDTIQWTTYCWNRIGKSYFAPLRCAAQIDCLLFSRATLKLTGFFTDFVHAAKNWNLCTYLDKKLVANTVDVRPTPLSRPNNFQPCRSEVRPTLVWFPTSLGLISDSAGLISDQRWTPPLVDRVAEYISQCPTCQLHYLS